VKKKRKEAIPMRQNQFIKFQPTRKGRATPADRCPSQL
jgi:hypothetical protein